MIKIAIAGTNGLAQYIAHFISSQTSHQFVIFSRRPSPGLSAKGWQVIQLDYTNSRDLRFKLAGVDTVISTISGNAQLALIEAAASAHVRRFVPSEFGGPPSLRPQNDLLDNGRHAAILRLHQLESTGMRFTVFTCGIFMERFAPGGMAASQIGLRDDVGREGRYLVDMRQRRAQIPHHESTGRPVSICLTSARDVARFVVAAIDLNVWPREFRLCAQRINVKDLVTICEQVRHQSFEVSNYTRDSLQDASTYARAVHDMNRQMQLHYLMATADRRFDFVDTNLNQLVSVRPERFREFMTRVWAGRDLRTPKTGNLRPVMIYGRFGIIPAGYMKPIGTWSMYCNIWTLFGTITILFYCMFTPSECYSEIAALTNVSKCLAYRSHLFGGRLLVRAF